MSTPLFVCRRAKIIAFGLAIPSTRTSSNLGCGDTDGSRRLSYASGRAADKRISARMPSSTRANKPACTLESDLRWSQNALETELLHLSSTGPNARGARNAATDLYAPSTACSTSKQMSFVKTVSRFEILREDTRSNSFCSKESVSSGLGQWFRELEVHLW